MIRESMEFPAGLRMAAARVALTTGLIASGACVTQESSAPATTVKEWSITVPEPEEFTSVEVCLEPTPEELVATEELVDTPVQPTAYEASDYEEKIEAKNNTYSLIAEELGLTVHKKHDFEQPLRDDIQKIINPDEADPALLTIDEYIAKTQEFLGLYGVTLEINTNLQPVSTPALDKQPLDDLDNLQTRRNLANLISAFGVLPQELIDYVGLKQIVLTDIVKDMDAVGLVMPQIMDDTIFLDPNHYLSEIVSMHEFYHLLDHVLCPGESSRADPQLRKLNPVDIYALGFDLEASGYESKSGSLSRRVDLISLLSEARSAGDLEKVGELESQLTELLAKMVVQSEYGLTKPQEDKAEIGAGFLTEYGFGVFDPASPILSEKAEYLFARLYAALPQVAKYLVIMGSGSRDFARVDSQP